MYIYTGLTTYIPTYTYPGAVVRWRAVLASTFVAATCKSGSSASDHTRKNIAYSLKWALVLGKVIRFLFDLVS